MTQRVVVNDGLINYGLSELAYKELGQDWEREVVWPIQRINPEYVGLYAGMAYKDDRSNPELVACVEKLGESAGVPGTYFIIVDVQDNDSWEIVPRVMGGEDIIIYLGGNLKTQTNEGI
jgi:hypothetical protein